MINESCLMPLIPNTSDIVQIPNNIQPYDVEDYDMFDEKDKGKFITDLERFVRSSFEYRNMINYLREYVNMRNCAFLPFVSNENTPKIRIEIHHSPLTLYDICSIIINKRMQCKQSLLIEAVAYEVLWVHYSLMLGLIPLSETVHELVHTNYIFVPTDRVYGYYKQFVQTYYNYIDPELLDRLDELERLTVEGNQDSVYKEVLEKKYIAVDMGENSQLDKLHDLQGMLKERLNEYRDDISGNIGHNVSHPQNIEQK